MSNIKTRQVSVGHDHTVIVDLHNNCWTYGSNVFGELGLGDTLDRSIPTLIPNIKVLHFSVGYTHTVIIDLDHNIWIFGLGSNGQLGLGSDLRAMIIKRE